MSRNRSASNSAEVDGRDDLITQLNKQFQPSSSASVVSAPACTRMRRMSGEFSMPAVEHAHIQRLRPFSRKVRTSKKAEPSQIICLRGSCNKSDELRSPDHHQLTVRKHPPVRPVNASLIAERGCVSSSIVNRQAVGSAPACNRCLWHIKDRSEASLVAGVSMR